MELILFLIYLSFCILVAYAGRNVSIGFGGLLVMCFLLTPLVTAVFVLMFRSPKPKNRVVYKYKISELSDLDEN